MGQGGLMAKLIQQVVDPASVYNPMSGNPSVNAVGSTATTPVVAAPSAVSPQQQAANALAAQVKSLQQTTPATIAANKAATDINNTQADNLQNQTNAINTGTDSSVASVSQAFNALGVKGYGGTSITGDTQTQLDALAAQRDKADAFALITNTMQTYGFTPDELSQITDFIQSSLVNPNMGPNQTMLGIRALPAYQKRFNGNAIRIANGLNALSEGNYMQQEDSMRQYLTAHGVGNLGTRTTLANIIGNGIAATDVNTRAALAVDQVQNADPQILAQLKTYYPSISQGDLVSYFLDPANTLPALQQKVTTGQIGAAFQEQGLDAGKTNMEDLTAYGVTQNQAIAGAGNIASILPTATKLGDIYGASGVKYDQMAGEAEFLKSDDAAALKRKQIASMERAQYSGDAGINPQASNLASARTVQGKF